MDKFLGNGFNELRSELQNLKENLDKGFISLGKRFSSIEYHAAEIENEAILFKKFITKFFDFI